VVCLRRSRPLSHPKGDPETVVGNGSGKSWWRRQARQREQALRARSGGHHRGAPPQSRRGSPEVSPRPFLTPPVPSLRPRCAGQNTWWHRQDASQHGTLLRRRPKPGQGQRAAPRRVCRFAAGARACLRSGLFRAGDHELVTWRVAAWKVLRSPVDESTTKKTIAPETSCLPYRSVAARTSVTRSGPCWSRCCPGGRSRAARRHGRSGSSLMGSGGGSGRGCRGGMCRSGMGRGRRCMGCSGPGSVMAPGRGS